jgi:hypothetical protein
MGANSQLDKRSFRTEAIHDQSNVAKLGRDSRYRAVGVDMQYPVFMRLRRAGE